MRELLRNILLTGQILLISLSVQAKVFYVLPKENLLSGDGVEQIKSNLSEFNVLKVERAVQLKEKNRIHRVYGWYKIEIGNSEEINHVKSSLLSHPSMEIVEESVVRYTCGVTDLDERTNDPLLPHQWYLDRISAFAAWDELAGAEETVVAVIDNGVDVDHPDLINRMWHNQEEINGQPGVDDDGNGYIDDKYGFDAYQWDGDPSPSNTFAGGHGTHCAGLIAAEQNNGIGIAGVGPNIKIMAVRAGYDRTIYNSPQSIVYAAENGADVISMSFSSTINEPTQSQFEQDAIDFAVSQGCILVAAAGNDSDTGPFFPAAYTNVIAVASSDEADYLSSFSNYGYWVDVSAPGSNIISTIVDGYGYMSGTSMATPLVAGIVASLKGIYPDLTTNEAVSRLQFGSETLLGLQNTPLNAGRVNFWRASASGHPIIEIIGTHVQQPTGNNEGNFDYSLDLRFKLYAESPVNVAISILPSEDQLIVNHLEILNNLEPGEYTIENIGLLATQNTRDGLNQITVQLAAQADQTWSDEKMVLIPINSPWRTHDNGGIIGTITNFGAIGYFDNKYNREETQGVRLASERFGFLFHGSILVSDGVRISDAADRIYSMGEGDHDFVGSFVDTITTDESQIFEVFMEDSGNMMPLGISIEQTTTSYLDKEYILFNYDVLKNNNSTNDLTFSMFFDWDIGDISQNMVDYDEALKLSYMYGSTGYAGVTYLGGDGELVGASAISAPYFNFNSEDRIRNYLGEGFSNATTVDGDDFGHIVNVSLPGVNSATPVNAQFAMVLGKTEEEFFQNVADVREFFFRNPAIEPNTLPGKVELVRQYPNPFNANVLLDFNLPEISTVDVSIFNILGRKIYTFEPISGKSGRISLNWDGKDNFGKDVSSGVYILNYRSGKSNGSDKLILLR